MQQIGVQKIFWDSFELVINTHAQRLARDIADSLAQDAKPLLESIQSEKVGVYLFEDSEETNYMEMRCAHYRPIPTMPYFVVECMEPVLWFANSVGRSCTCLYHSLHPCVKHTSWVVLQPYRDGDDTYYLDSCNERVYNAEGNICGTFKNKCVRVFRESGLE
jgi:hypothetical protein